ncbi:Predicted transcriptional regulator, ArsR family [Propionibacterium cyclohexanicum]|uniref:Predicted transcriptional regulator, ArsR family n=1 Tax=Propionibacterium cyclohexanicum TaxID=64702 RepID=A0A1H9U1L6_9ACTN|nr:MoaD/ThiS family protein [Propionibacterium cyclohexanicum]SES03336.1 Predicted transcriptional regulator, ArsR family [Propionibacterium cyclohexanicum]
MTIPEADGVAPLPRDRAEGRGLGAVLTAVAHLTPAQHALLSRLSARTRPATVTELAKESDLHVSSVRETLDALLDLGLVSREQLPAAGRGRPALGYTSFTPADPTFPAQMLTQVTGAVFAWLRISVPDPRSAAYQIGRNWGDRALASLHVPDHTSGAPVPEGFRLSGHMDKIRMFLTAFGFEATADPDNPTSLVLNSCPFTDPQHPDPLALEMRRGMVERVLQLTATDLADVEYLADSSVPVRCRVNLTERPAPHRRQLVTSIRYYGGAAEAAGCRTEQLDPGSTPATLGELLDRLEARHPGLAPVLAVSSYFVDQQQAGRDDPIAEGSLIDVLPPFAGG